MDPFDVMVKAVEALRRHSAEFAIGGSMALAMHAEPRATMDVDINVFVSSRERVAQLLNSLMADGFTLDEPPEAALSRAMEHSQFRIFLDGVRIDVFPATNEIYQEFASRTVSRSHPELGEVRVISAEDLATMKCVYDRQKDRADLQVLREHLPGLNTAFIKGQLARILGDGDSRIDLIERLGTNDAGAGR